MLAADGPQSTDTDGPWLRDRNHIYRPMMVAWRDGDPVYETEFTIRIDPGKAIGFDIRLAEMLAEEVRTLLNKDCRRG
jgi:hypothetical protein